MEGVTLQYKTKEHIVTAAYKVDFQVYPSDRFILLGPSGCGKTTLLKGVSGFMQPVAGKIKLKGEEITKPGPERMMVFQEFDQLLPWKTVKQNVMFPLVSSAKMGKEQAEEQAMAYIEKVKHHHPFRPGLGDFRRRERHASAGSGGRDPAIQNQGTHRHGCI